MASIDNLRDKIRSNREVTRELSDTSSTVSQQFNPPGKETISQSPTDSLISEIFSEETDDEVNFAQAFEPEPVQQNSGPFSDAPPKKGFALPFAHYFKHREINRKMLFISLGVAALASFLSISYLKGIAEPLKGKSQMIKVVALTQDVPSRTVLTEEMVTIKEIPSAYLPEGVMEYKENMKLLGQVTTTALYKGEVIHSRRVSLPSEDTGITAITPDGYRPISITMDNASFIKPSSAERKEYVDVIATLPDPNPVRRGKLITIPVLQRAQVLAVGNHMSAEAVNESASPASNITLAVPAERVNLMVILREKGNFNVIPRSSEDSSTQPERYTVEEIEDALQGKFEAEKVAVEPAAVVVEPKEIKEEPEAALVDLSAPVRQPAYRAPARKPVYRAPARKPVYRAPARPAARPAAVKPAVKKPYRAPLVINGGVVTQGGGK